MANELFLLDLDLGPRVMEWGSMEEIQEVLLSKATLFSGQLSCVLDNHDKALSKGYQYSLIYKRTLDGLPVSVYVGGKLKFSGVLKDIQEDAQARTATLLMENAFSRPTESQVEEDVVAVNPAIAALRLLLAGGVDPDLLDQNSFVGAAGPSLGAGATITTHYAGTGTSTLDALQQISDQCSINFYVRGGVVRARAFRPYTGNGAGLRQPIYPGNVRNFRTKATAWQNFNNAVLVKYGAGLQYKVAAPTGALEKLATFDATVSAPLEVPDLKSAVFFATTYVARAGTVRDVVTLELDAGLLTDATIGFRYPVTAPQWGLDQAPFEVIETGNVISSKAMDLTLASLS